MKTPVYLRIVPLLLFAIGAVSGLSAMTLEGFRSLPDPRIEVRRTYGVREAVPLADREVLVRIGISVTGEAGNPAAYRVISDEDERYAYDRFVRPSAAAVQEKVEFPGVKGSRPDVFRRQDVLLTLPFPMRPGVRYSIMAQGVAGTMVTAAHTAGSFVYGEEGQGEPRDPRIDAAVTGLRAIRPVGAGILELDLGPGFSPELGMKAGACEVTVNGQAEKVLRMGRRTWVDAYIPVGWPFSAIPTHRVYLQTGHAWTDGDRVQVRIAEDACAGLREASFTFHEAETRSPSLKVNQVGYLAGGPVKHAYVGLWMGSFPEADTGRPVHAGQSMDAMFREALAGGEPVVAENIGPALMLSEPPVFHVRDAATGAIVFSGRSELIHRSGTMNEGVHNVDHSGENVYRLDFSDFRTGGEYFITVPGVGRSHPFRVGEDVYREAFDVQSYGVFAQRCGIELGPPYSSWRRIACHIEGIVPTTMSRVEGERAAHKELPAYVDYSALTDAEPDPAIQALNRDPALLAYWPMDGSLKDVTGNGYDLQPAREGQPFERVRELLPGNNLALGPTATAQPNGGLVPDLPLDVTRGFTLSTWVKLEGGIKFSGSLFGSMSNNVHLSRIQVTAGWGVIRASVGSTDDPLDIGRLSDGKWHHIALIVTPQAQGPARVAMTVDGEVRDTALAGRTEPLDDATFHVGALTGDEAGGKYFDDVRVYSRPLTMDEIAVLATRWGDKAIAIQAHGGHHDAGDYNPRSHIEVAQILMNAYEMAPRKFYDGQLNIPEAGNGIPDILDEAGWALRIWTGLQEDDGGVRGGTESNGDPNFMQTVELDTLGDYAFAKDAGASFEFAGTFAQAARILKSLGMSDRAAEYLDRAERAFAWGLQHPPEQLGDPAKYATFFISPKAYAAAELLHTTGKARYREAFAEAAVWSTQPDAELEKHRLYDQRAAAWAYVKCPAEVVDPDLQARIRKAILARADQFIQYCSTMAYGFIRHPWAPITWGTGAYQSWLDPIHWAYTLTGDETYLYWMIKTADNTLGANPLGLSWITGLGERTVRGSLHNSRYNPTGEVAPGMQVQGPHQGAEGYRVAETAYPRYRPDFAPLYTYVDVHFAIVMNEGTVVPQARSMAAFGLLLPDATEP